MDHLRTLSQQARGVLAMQSRIRAAERRLEQALMRAPTDAEMADDLGLPPQDYARWRMEIDSARIHSLDDIYTDSRWPSAMPPPALPRKSNGLRCGGFPRCRRPPARTRGAGAATLLR